MSAIDFCKRSAICVVRGSEENRTKSSTDRFFADHRTTRHAVIQPRLFWDDKAGRLFFATTGVTIEGQSCPIKNRWLIIGATSTSASRQPRRVLAGTIHYSRSRIQRRGRVTVRVNASVAGGARGSHAPSRDFRGRRTRVPDPRQQSAAASRRFSRCVRAESAVTYAVSGLANTGPPSRS